MISSRGFLAFLSGFAAGCGVGLLWIVLVEVARLSGAAPFLMLLAMSLSAIGCAAVAERKLGWPATGGVACGLLGAWAFAAAQVVIH